MRDKYYFHKSLEFRERYINRQTDRHKCVKLSRRKKRERKNKVSIDFIYIWRVEERKKGNKFTHTHTQRKVRKLIEKSGQHNTSALGYGFIR